MSTAMSTATLVAVTGATGQLGRLAVAALKARVAPGSIVALARDPARAADLGVPVRLADYDRPETLGPALAGVARLLLISGSEVGRREPQHRAVIAAAKAAGVETIAYTSLLHADRSELDLAGEHRATEALLAASGIPFTLLRNGWYAENYTGGLARAVAGGALLGSAGEGRISAAARRDYAEAAAVVVSGDGHDGKVYELAADDPFTLADLAAEVSAQTGKAIPYRDLPEGDYAAALAGLGVPEPLARAIAGWDAAAARGAFFDDSRTLSRLTGRPTTPLAATVRAALGAAGGQA